MRVVVQRVSRAKCVVNKEVISEIDKGLMLLVGFEENDDLTLDFDYFAKKIASLRIFSDQDDKLNLSVKDIDGSILCISQFTLYGDVRKGNRPSFTKAKNYNEANILYEKFVEKLNLHVRTLKGSFGSDMAIDFVNDGPVTILIDSDDWK